MARLREPTMQTTRTTTPLSDRDLYRLAQWTNLYNASSKAGMDIEEYQQFVKRAEFARYLMARKIISES
jgi:hypothetical protein